MKTYIIKNRKILNELALRIGSVYGETLEIKRINKYLIAEISFHSNEKVSIKILGWYGGDTKCVWTLSYITDKQILQYIDNIPKHLFIKTTINEFIKSSKTKLSKEISEFYD